MHSLPETRSPLPLMASWLPPALLLCLSGSCMHKWFSKELCTRTDVLGRRKMHLGLSRPGLGFARVIRFVEAQDVL